MTTYAPSVRPVLPQLTGRATAARRLPVPAPVTDAGRAETGAESRDDAGTSPRAESRAAARERHAQERAVADRRAAHADRIRDNRAARHPLALR